MIVMARASQRPSRRPASSRSFAMRVATPNVRFGAITSFLVLVFLMGGGSRGDISSLAVLRPIAAAYAAYATILISREQGASVRFPIIFFGLCAALVLVQLIPLPPAMWSALPGRDVYADTFRSGGIVMPWEPLAISPGRALNSLMSLLIPLAAVLLFAIQEPERRMDVFVVLWVMALVSVCLGILQLAGAPSGPLYFYRITNNGLPVGLFSNRNHQSLMTGIGVLLSAAMVVRELRRRPISWPRLVGIAGIVFILAPFLLIAGSRAGLLVGISLVALGCLYVTLTWRSLRKRRGAEKPRSHRGALIVGCVAFAFVALMATMMMFSRSLALDRLLGKSVEFDLRFQILPTVLRITSDQFPFGSGFGSFELIYRQFEPSELLMPSYVNHVHNDWLQVVLEGGLPAAILLAALLIWLAHAAFTSLRGKWTRIAPNVFSAFAIVASMGVFSFLDYPLRTPSLLAVFALCLAQIAVERSKWQLASE